ncbi:hypothetical protein OK006_7651 [Actinobacteria bacterium OK006]|nr:hypothetical protein OK006_7651 [Actinobacteria bacterium OK006]
MCATLTETAGRWTRCRAVHAWRASCAAGRHRTTARPTAQGHRRRGRLTVNLDRVFPASPFPTETKELLGSRNCLPVCQAAEYVITRPARRASFGHPWRVTATPFRDRHAFQVITSPPGMSPILGAEFAAVTGGEIPVFGTPYRLAGFGGRAAPRRLLSTRQECKKTVTDAPRCAASDVGPPRAPGPASGRRTDMCRRQDPAADTWRANSVARRRMTVRFARRIVARTTGPSRRSASGKRAQAYVNDT